jgi:hypothetical protein
MYKRIIIFILFITVIFSVSIKTVLAISEGGTCITNVANQCDAGLICNPNTSLCEKDPNSPLPSVNSASGRGESANSGSNQSKCDKPGDEFCPAPKFCYINGLCVPAPEAEAREGSLRGAGSIFEVIAIVLKWLLTLAGVIATVFLILGGYQYITAGGNEEQSEKGKQTLINAVIGIVIVLLSMTIITIVTNTLSSTGPLG